MLSDLKKKAEAATPGPYKFWDHTDDDEPWGTFSVQSKATTCGPDFFISDADGVDDTTPGSLLVTSEQAEYIAAASPDVVLKLIAVVEAAPRHNFNCVCALCEALKELERGSDET